MNTTTLAVATGVVVTAGRWSEGKGIELNVAIGATTFAVFLAVLQAANEKFAGQVALLILFAALFRYVPSIAPKISGKRRGGGGTF